MNRERLLPLLHGRWLAIKYGIEPKPIQTIDQIFHNNKYSYHRGDNRRGRVRSVSAQQKIRMLVESLDRKAKETYNGSENIECDNRSKED